MYKSHETVTNSVEPTIQMNTTSATTFGFLTGLFFMVITPTLSQVPWKSLKEESLMTAGMRFFTVRLPVTNRVEAAA